MKRYRRGEMRMVRKTSRGEARSQDKETEETRRANAGRRIKAAAKRPVLREDIVGVACLRLEDGTRCGQEGREGRRGRVSW